MNTSDTHDGAWTWNVQLVHNKIKSKQHRAFKLSDCFTPSFFRGPGGLHNISDSPRYFAQIRNSLLKLKLNYFLTNSRRGSKEKLFIFHLGTCECPRSSESHCSAEIPRDDPWHRKRSRGRGHGELLGPPPGVCPQRPRHIQPLRVTVAVLSRVIILTETLTDAARNFSLFSISPVARLTPDQLGPSPCPPPVTVIAPHTPSVSSPSDHKRIGLAGLVDFKNMLEFSF